MNSLYTLEKIDWSSDCIWDAWLRGVFSDKAEIDKHLVLWQDSNKKSRFRVLEVEVNSNIITGGWIVVAGQHEYKWVDADIEDVKFMGR